MKFIEEKVDKIVGETKHIYESLKQKVEKFDFKVKKPENTFQNVHKRIKNA